MSELHVVMVMPEKKRPYITDIPNSTREFEQLVGGPVDILNFHQQYRLVCNIDEGYDLTYNKKKPSSTFFIVKYQGQFESLSEAEAEEVSHVLKLKLKKWK
ncbi:MULTISPECIES: DUF3846 domain-containing protein [Fictibacillus]|uniref:DUF3846 domain-containing protein n=1 Tax=Fictibacillus enclensis TaxID=1017270 RepID=A0A0V8J4Z6_9BACL|nr:MULTISPECIES: hypothetical protein [Fictibacillus]KSU82067.1 hypothetical protein AS030_17495 [Fictibacillus enclensis]RXZ01486.1 hypothetical protein DMO16_18570 [Fictibacillus sp. S7]SCC29823.1 hypothetical protein GA0061096_3678 [Fictibacillus enclensis]